VTVCAEVVHILSSDDEEDRSAPLTTHSAATMPCVTAALTQRVLCSFHLIPNLH